MIWQHIVFDIETIALPGVQPPKFEAPSNYKDPVKIAANIVQQQRDWAEDAALHAERARVALIGVMDDKLITFYDTPSENLLLESFWHFASSQADARFVGHCINHFDVPFLVRRSMLLGIRYPSWVFDGRYLSNRFVDTMTLWGCGDRQARISLDTLARACGFEGKDGSGADFGRLWIEDKLAAVAYCERDLQLVWQIAEHIGVIPKTKP